MNVLIVVLLLAVVTYTSGANVSQTLECVAQKPSIYEAKIKVIINQLGKKFRDEGIPELNLPSIDPVLLKDLHIKTNPSGLIGLDWIVEYAEVKGLSQFEVTGVTLNVSDMSFGLSFKWPLVHGQGIYKMRGFFALMPVFGGGKFDVSGHDLELEGQGRLSVDEKKHLRMDQSIARFKMAKPNANFTGPVDSELISKKLTDIFYDTLSTRQFNQGIANKINLLVMLLINKWLAGKTIADVIAELGFSC